MPIARPPDQCRRETAGRSTSGLDPPTTCGLPDPRTRGAFSAAPMAAPGVVSREAHRPNPGGCSATGRQWCEAHHLALGADHATPPETTTAAVAKA